MDDNGQFSRRDFIKVAGLAALGTGGASSLVSSSKAQAASTTETATTTKGKGLTANPYNILMIVTDQERHLSPDDYPAGYQLPGHEWLAQHGVVFENHQIGSCVCTPSRAVLYTGQHIQNNGMFDNTNFPWSASMSTEIDTLGDLLRQQGYYTAYKGKWHLTDEFETINDLHMPKKILSEEMEAYGFSDYFGIGDVIGHTEGGYLHDDVISAMTRSWLRGKAAELQQDQKPWFMAVNLVNPHDVMYYNTDKPGQSQQSDQAMMRLNREPKIPLYASQWDIKLPESRHQPLQQAGRPAAHMDYTKSRAMMVGSVPDEDDRWHRLNNYYLNCIRDVDQNITEILNELEAQGLDENTIVIFTADHGELGGAHGLSGKGATAYREQNNVPLVIAHPAFDGGKRCQAVTSHVDIATTLISLAGGDSTANATLPGKDISSLLQDPEAAPFDAIRTGALYNFNMIAYLDGDFFNQIGHFFANGGTPEQLPSQGFKPDLKKRGAIRSIYDGQYKLNRYFSPLHHHVPETLEQLFEFNDVELFDLVSDPHELTNLALDRIQYSDQIQMMNDKLNVLIAAEVGEDLGQMLPQLDDVSWALTTSPEDIRL